jgi:hypothetical protein
MRGHPLEHRDGFLSIVLLKEADDGVEDDDGEDGAGVHHLAQRTGDEPGRNEYPDNDTLELTQKISCSPRSLQCAMKPAGDRRKCWKRTSNRVGSCNGWS